MGEILSQNEIDSLLAALSSGEIDAEEMSDASDKQVKNYDFKRPTKFSKEHLRTLEIIYEHYGRLLSTSLPVYLRKSVQVSVSSAEAIVFSEFTNALFNPVILGVVNFVISIGVEIYNLIATFANFFANVFNDPVGAIINLFAGMFDFILGIVQSAASLIDTVLGTDMSGAVAGFRNTVATKVEEIVGEQVEVMQKLDASDYQIQRIEYGDAWAAGNNFGRGIEDTVGGLFSGFSTDPSNMGDDLGGGGAGYVPYDELSKGVGDISDNTGSMAKSLEVSGEELEYLRDIAERDAINRFTTAEVKIDMTGMTNKIDGGADLDGVIRELTDGFTEALVTAAEGVHA